jgi:deazaflavin-dependent oxidoreductase (nitroreductase family)
MDTTQFTPAQMNSLRKAFKTLNKFMVFMWKIRLGRFINIWPTVGGRRSGKERLAPVNYAIVDDEIYCTAGFGAVSDWYRNMMKNPHVELWLPGKKIHARADDVSDSPQRAALLRAVITASGFAAPLFGINPKKFSDEDLLALASDYRLIHFKQENE